MSDQRASEVEPPERPPASWFRIGVVLLVLAIVGSAVMEFVPQRWEWWQSMSWWTLLALEAGEFASPMLAVVGLGVIAGPLHRMAGVWQSRTLLVAAWIALGLALALAVQLCLRLLWASGVVNPIYLGRSRTLALLATTTGALAVLCVLCCLGAVRVSAWSREMRWARWVAWALVLVALWLWIELAQQVLAWTRAGIVSWVWNDLDGARAWALMVLALAAPVVGVVLVRRADRLFERPERGDVCRGCGYDLRGFEGLVCPECGVGREATERQSDEATRGEDDAGPMRAGVVEANARRMRRCARLVSWGCGLLAPGGVVLCVGVPLVWLRVIPQSSAPTTEGLLFEVSIVVKVLLFMGAAIGVLMLPVAAVLAWWPLRWYGRARGNVWFERAPGLFLSVPVLIVLWFVLEQIREGPDLSVVVGGLLATGFWCLARGVGLEIERGDHGRAARRARLWLRITALVVALDAAAIFVAIVADYLDMSIGTSLTNWADALPPAMMPATLLVLVVGFVGARRFGRWIVEEGKG